MVGGGRAGGEVRGDGVRGRGGRGWRASDKRRTVCGRGGAVGGTAQTPADGLLGALEIKCRRRGWLSDEGFGEGLRRTRKRACTSCRHFWWRVVRHSNA